MEQIKFMHLKCIIQRMVADPRMRPVHIALCLALCHAWIDQGFNDQYRVTRKLMMRSSHIRSIATYHKTIKELQSFGYFKYAPSYHPLLGSEVTLLNSNPVLHEQH